MRPPAPPAIAIFSIALYACSNPLAGADCADSSDCGSGLVCRQGECAETCADNSECGADQRCLLGACVSVAGGDSDTGGDSRTGDEAGGDASQGDDVAGDESTGDTLRGDSVRETLYPAGVWSGLADSEFVPWDTRADATNTSVGGLGTQTVDTDDGVLVMDGFLPIIAFEEQSGTAGGEEVHVLAFDGTSWQPIGDSDDPAGIGYGPLRSVDPSSAMHPTRGVLIALQEEGVGTSNAPGIQVMEFSNSSWDANTTPGNGLAQGDATSGELNLFVSGSSSYVSYADSDGVYVFVHDDTSWSQLGNDVSDSDPEAEPAWASVTVDGNGDPVVVWARDTNSTILQDDWHIWVARYDGADWVEMQTGSATGTGVLSNGSINDATNPTITTDGQGRVVVAWEVAVGVREQIYAKRFNGTTWEEMDGSASTDGVSATTGDASRAELTVDSGGDPILVWQDTRSGVEEIYLKRWNGSAWVEHNGSATGGGISNSAAASVKPHAAAGGGVICVTWFEDHGATDCQQIVRCSPE